MKTVKSIVISSLLATLGVSVLAPVSVAEIKDNQVNALVDALKQAAPPQRPNDGMYSSWQVLPGIIPSWTKQCVGKEMTPEKFDQDEKAARQTVSCIVRRELQTQYKTVKNETQAVKNVACWWMTGKTDGCKSGTPATYVDKVNGFYQQKVK